jgi:hypothetical protein
VEGFLFPIPSKTSSAPTACWNRNSYSGDGLVSSSSSKERWSGTTSGFQISSGSCCLLSCLFSWSRDPRLEC